MTKQNERTVASSRDASHSLAESQSLHRGVYVPAGDDRLQEQRKVFGTMPIAYKLLPPDTEGSLLVLEHTDDRKGGPPRHLHLDQEEWFYIISGTYKMEIGDAKYSLEAGDSILAPRKVPHVWASVGEEPGRLIIAFQPAGQMQAFFSEVTKLHELPPREELQKLFRAHGMELIGPPLSVSDK